MITLPKNLMKQFAEFYRLVKSGELRTFMPLLPMLKINGQSMNMKYHYQFAPLFNTVLPAKTVVMCGRQLGKSYSLCASSILRSMFIPGFHQLLLEPQDIQIKRLNASVYQPLLRSCPLVSEFIPSVEASKLALKTYNNGSLAYLDFCGSNNAGDCRRLRGISGVQMIWGDELADIPSEYLPIIVEVMSAAINWGFTVYTGTPKTTDTTMGLEWNKSSQAEWVIKCPACNHQNIPNPEHDLIKMIGKHGPICAKCGRPVDISTGGFIHAYPDRMLTYAGLHVSQSLHPLHSINDLKWGRILDKVDSYDQTALYQECFGWPYDSATSPLTLSDIIDAEYDPIDDTNHIVDIQKPSDVKRISNKYCYITVAVDWGGGSACSDSYTAFAVLGLHPGGQVIDILYGERLPKGLTPTEEATRIMRWIDGAGANAFAYDNGGAGFVRLETMKHAGLMEIPGLTVVPINYVATRSGDVMKPNTNQREVDMYYYTLDKSRSLAMCIAAIKMKRIRFRRFNHEDSSAYPRDFLALYEDPREMRGRETVIYIMRRSGVPDDFAHAVNFGCSQIWDHFGAYPQIGQKYDASMLDMEHHRVPVEDDAFGPRGDFDRFVDACNLQPTVITPDYDDFY